MSLGVGVALGWVEFTVAGLLATVLLLVCLLYTIGRPNLQARVELTGRSVTVGSGPPACSTSATPRAEGTGDPGWTYPSGRSTRASRCRQ
ncbi:hypothetical protein G7085_13110 [Tessaracoccus sp. HDW20]|uniref:hypothetical protein n=1 Tax=Tessaracoccus coleopterorum TaxID=2714950 RepID=UPI0018D4CAC5|nr:hypothetical protein [Tessaracoccus coleopterorum]NHB85252.1 hypothetical protein [Tessaracoccus coleopterorum]